MTTLVMTGFPGFLGSALLPRLLARRPDASAVCLVQARYMAQSLRRVDAIERSDPRAAGRIRLVAGDITVEGLGLDPEALDLADVTELWHLAAVYDLTVPQPVARRVNVDGTSHVVAMCRSLPRLRSLQYVSTCYVSGDHPGEFPEDALDLGQGFLNHYEATKFEAEALVRDAMDAGLPATIYRPGMVVGDSVTGETQKLDGPYMAASFIRKQPLMAVLPAVGPPDEVRASLVPRDYVIAAMDELSVMDRAIGRTYALTDPSPPTARQFAEVVAQHLGKRVLWVPVPLGITRAVVGWVPGIESLLGLPAEVLDYFATRTTYATTNAVADLAGTGVECPAFETYAARMLDYMIAHPEIGSAAMV